MRKVWLVLNCIFKNRHDFNIGDLESIRDNHDFIYAMLPYVARAFSLSIVVLPEKLCVPAALGYCYCRILDTFEDMLPDPTMRSDALRAVPRLLRKIIKGDNYVADAQMLSRCEQQLVQTKRKDAAYCLLVREIYRINQVFGQQDFAVKHLVYRLVKKMSRGMVKNTADYKEKTEKITDKKIEDYCKSVIGYPLMFIYQLLQWDKGNQDFMHVNHRKDIIKFSQFIQLANITRDVEEDLLNNVVYHDLLLPYKNKDSSTFIGDPVLKGCISRARKDLIAKAISSLVDIDFMDVMKKNCVDAYGTRLSALLFVRFSENFYKNLVYRHYAIGREHSTYWMILTCMLMACCNYATEVAVQSTVDELRLVKARLFTGVKRLEIN